MQFRRVRDAKHDIAIRVMLESEVLKHPYRMVIVGKDRSRDAVEPKRFERNVENHADRAHRVTSPNERSPDPCSEQPDSIDERSERNAADKIAVRPAYQERIAPAFPRDGFGLGDLTRETLFVHGRLPVRFHSGEIVGGRLSQRPPCRIVAKRREPKDDAPRMDHSGRTMPSSLMRFFP